MNERFHWQLSLLPAVACSPAVLVSSLSWEHSPGAGTPSPVHQRGREYCVYQQRRNLIRAVTCGSSTHILARVSQAVAGPSTVHRKHRHKCPPGHQFSRSPALECDCTSIVALHCLASCSVVQTTDCQPEEWKYFWQWVWRTVWLCACLLLIFPLFHFLASNATIMSNNKESDRVSTGN